MMKPQGNSAQSSVYVVDDDDGMRRALETLLGTVGFNTVAFSRPADFLAAFHADAPGCLVLDIRMPDMSGLEVQQRLNAMGSMLPVIFITGHGDVPMAVQAIKEGAFEFLQKPFRDQALIDCINHALDLDTQNRAAMARHAEVAHRIDSLTPRERQIMELIVDGAANKVIAIDLGLSERTVEIHRANVMTKMGTRSVAHLVRLHMKVAPQV